MVRKQNLSGSRGRSSRLPIACISLVAIVLLAGCSGQVSRQQSRVFISKAVPSISADSLVAVGNSLSPAVIGTPAGSWIECAVEFDVCTFNGTRRVRYGANDTYVIKELTAQDGGVPCINAVFGGDPAAGSIKRCYLEKPSRRSQPVRAPTVTTFIAML